MSWTGSTAGLTWIHELFQVYGNPKIIDPRRMLRVLAPYARFQATGYQVIGGVRLKVLRATTRAT